MQTAPVTVITGAAGALGSAVTDYLLERGHRIAAIDLDVSRLAPRAVANPGRLVSLTLNTPVDASWASALASIKTSLGTPTGAVLIAGGWAGGKPVHAESNDGTNRRMFDMNFDSAQRALHALLPSMVQHKSGSIVVVGSRAVERPWESKGAASYAASKSALVAYAQVVAAEVLESGVRVNAVLPSTLDTAANRASMPAADPSRWVAPASLARVIAFLLSDEARDVSGAAIPVYGRA